MGQTRAAYGHKSVCSQCERDFIAYRRTAKYCSEACKQQAKRDREMGKAVAEVRQLARDIADPRGAEPEEDLREELRLARLEAILWEKAFHAFRT